MPIATRTIYRDERGNEVAADADGAFLVANEGAYISQDDADRYGGAQADPAAYDAIADHRAKHGGESDAEAERKRQLMLAGHPDPDGPAVTGERGDLAAADADTDAKSTRAPANTKARTAPDATK